MSEQSVRGVLKALGCYPPRGRWVTIRCPSHDDRCPSLGVRVDDRGLFLKCHAGCSTEEIVAHLGFTMADLFFENGTPLPNLAELEGRWRRGSLRWMPPYVTTDSDTRHSDTRNSVFPTVSCDSRLDELGPTARRVLRDLIHVASLYAAVGERRPTPYSARFCAERMGWAGGTFRRASRTLAMLAKAGYICHAETLQPRGGLPETKCYVVQARGWRYALAAGWLPNDSDSGDDAREEPEGPSAGATDDDIGHSVVNADAFERAQQGDLDWGDA